MAVLKYLFFVMAGLTCLECSELTATNTPQTFETYGYSFGLYYSSFMYETWSIETEDSSNVVQVVIEMDIESSGGCYYDSLQIYDGSNTAAETLGTFCGTSSDNTVTGSGRDMFVVFRSDYSMQGRGFKIRYKQVPETDTIWMIVGIVLGVLITILSVCLILFLCCVCKSKNQVASIPLHYGQHQQPIWIAQRQHNHFQVVSAQNHFQVVPAQFVPPPAYQDITNQNSQAIEMQDMNRQILPEISDTSNNSMPTAPSDSLIVNSLPPRQH